MPYNVQDPGSQGDQGTTTGIFDSYLQAVPEEHREAVTGYLKDAEKNVNERLQEATKLKEAWEPYQQVETLQAYPPEQLSELLAWHQQVTSSDEAFREWLSNAAREAGLTSIEEQNLEDAEVQGELTREEVQQLIQQSAEERIAPIQEQYQTLQAEKMVDQEAQSIDQAFAALQAEFKLEFSKDQKSVILDLGMPLAVDARGNELPMGDSTWVAKGFERWKEITAEGQRAFVEDKSNGPGTPISTGGTEAFKPTTDRREATEQARERWRAMQT